MDNSLIQPALIVAAALVLSTAVVRRHDAGMTAIRQPARTESIGSYVAEAHAERAMDFGAGASIGLATGRAANAGGLALSNSPAAIRLFGVER